MLIKTAMSKAIEDFLKTDHLMNLNILGAIRNVPKAAIYVDNVNNPKGVFVERGYMHYLYTTEDHFIDEVADTRLKDGYYGFAGVEKSIAAKIKQRKKLDWDTPCNCYYYPHKGVDKSRIKHPVASLRPEDAALVNSYYTYKSASSLKNITMDISERPSSAVFVDGTPVCWVLVHDDNSMGIMYTMEGHRRKGYAEDVTLDLLSKIVDNGDIPFVQIVEHNAMSPGLAKKCGFVPFGKMDWFGIVDGQAKKVEKE